MMRKVIFLIIFIIFVSNSVVPNNLRSSEFSELRSEKITDQVNRVKRAAVAKRERLWDDGIIPYEIDSQFSGAHKALFIRAMRHWENFTCITFVQRKRSIHSNFIFFTIRQCGCCSFVGKQGSGGQTISIGKNCDKFGIVVHELGHVIGLWHEHTRPDRDDHVVIENDNIMNGHHNNFNKLTENDVNSLGLKYDFHSIMHYARNTFSKGIYLDTIFPKDEKTTKRSELGQRIKLSPGDIKQVNLLYQCPECGRTFQNNSGSFDSMSFLETHDYNLPCVWRITANHGEKIALNISELDLFKSDRCESDFLEVRDGYSAKSPLIERFCGRTKVGKVIWSTGTRIILILKMIKRTETYHGFTANYKAICGGNIQIRQTARLESPNYPLNYLPNKDCIWILKVRSGSRVALKFQSFDLENHDKCSYDYLEVRDGNTENSTLIGRYCGLDPPPDLVSSSDQMFVRFVSDRSGQRPGFAAVILREDDECSKGKHECQQECINTIGGYECACKIGYQLLDNRKSCELACGGQITDQNGTITSPSYPDVYPKSKHCLWEIVAPPFHRIILNFTHFDIEGSKYRWQECSYDSVRVYSKIRKNVINDFGTFCGTRIPKIIMSEKNHIRLEFKSDQTIQRSGFFAKFSTELDECQHANGGCSHMCQKSIGSFKCSCRNGFVLQSDQKTCKKGGCNYLITDPMGYITSPNYPNNYPNNTNCVWRFATTPGHRVQLNFTSFELEFHQECAFDHLEIYNGLTVRSFTLGRFCGNSTPGLITSTSNQMLIIFRADNSGQKLGFSANYSTACGGYLIASEDLRTFYSHTTFETEKYENNLNCEWIIEADRDQSVRLTFDIFDLEDDPDCAYDFIEIIEGYSNKMLGKFCGNTIPKPIESSFESLIVRFQTDSTVGFRGFSGTYTSIDPLDEEINEKS